MDLVDCGVTVKCQIPRVWVHFPFCSVYKVIKVCTVITEAWPQDTLCSCYIATTILTGTEKLEPITQIVFSLHWLHFIQARKPLLITDKTTYLDCSCCHLCNFSVHLPPHTLRWQGYLNIMKINNHRWRAFSFWAPSLWNNLSHLIREANTIDAFKWSLENPSTFTGLNNFLWTFWGLFCLHLIVTWWRDRQ